MTNEQIMQYKNYVMSLAQMFDGCQSLKEIDVSNFNVSNITSFARMFANCRSLTEIDISSFDTTNVTSMNQMFVYCYDLTTIYVSDLWDISNVTSSSNMFYECLLLEGSAGTQYSSSNVNVTYARVDKGTANPGYLTLKTI